MRKSRHDWHEQKQKAKTKEADITLAAWDGGVLGRFWLYSGGACLIVGACTLQALIGLIVPTGRA